jgi:hypothetical protein
MAGRSSVVAQAPSAADAASAPVVERKRRRVIASCNGVLACIN